MRLNSLAFRLTASAAIWSVAVLLIGGVILSEIFRASVERGFDLRLTVIVESLVAATEIDGDGAPELDGGGAGEPRFQQPYSGWYWQIEADGRTAARSRSLWDAQLSGIPALAAGEIRHLALDGPQGQKLRALARTITLPDARTPFVYVVAGNHADIDKEVASFNRILAWALAALGLGLIAAMLLQVHFGLQPVRRMRAGLVAIRSGQAERLDGDLPREIKPLSDELNALLEENAAVVERARTHVGNLAHALKTPLAVLANEASRDASPLGRQVARQTAVMRRHVDHYLARARTAAKVRVLGARSEVRPVVDDLVRTIKKIHAARAVTVTTDTPNGLYFRGERQDLEEMVGNLLDNACKWAASRVEVRLAQADGWLTLAIEDDGPGLDDGVRARVLERGARLDESVPGSGLGLAIVRDIARLYGGDIALERARLGGLSARLTLPAAPT